MTVAGDHGVPQGTALAGAASIIESAAQNETTRFNNLNSRGVAVLSATSLVTTLVGLYAKQIVGGTFKGTTLHWSIVGLVASLVLLVVDALIIVFGVLLPKRQLMFGNNDLTDNPASIIDDVRLQQIVFDEYRQEFVSLQMANENKGKALIWAYGVFVSAVLVIAATVIGVTIVNY